MGNQQNPSSRDQGRTRTNPAGFQKLEDTPHGESMGLERILDITMPVTVEFGRTSFTVQKLLDLRPGEVIPLNKSKGEPVDLYVEGVRFARGEIVVVDGTNFGLRLTEILDRRRRIEQLSQ